jgi:hypothetical protein
MKEIVHAMTFFVKYPKGPVAIVVKQNDLLQAYENTYKNCKN